MFYMPRVPIEENLKDVHFNVLFFFHLGVAGYACVDPLFDYGVYRVNVTIRTQ
jgi:hypothetical protein